MEDVSVPVHVNNSSSISNFQQCELGMQDLFSVADFETLTAALKDSLETFLSLELAFYRSRALLRISRTKVSNCGRIIKCDIRVQELIDCANENHEEEDEYLQEKQELALSRYLVEVLKSCEEKQDVQMNFIENPLPNKDASLHNVTGKDIKVLSKGTIKSMKITVICSSAMRTLHDGKQLYTDENDKELSYSTYNTVYRRDLSNWKIVREKIRDIFQSYEIFVKSNTAVDLRSCSLSKFSSYIFPGISFVFVNGCSMNSNGVDIGRINSRTKIIIQDIHHIDYFHRLYRKYNSVSKFSSVLNVDSQKLLINLIGTRLKVQVLQKKSISQTLSANYLISGPKSSGKKILVKEIAKQLQANLVVCDVSTESLLNVSRCSNYCQNIFDSAISSGSLYPTILLLLRLDLLFIDNKSELVTKSGQTGQTATNKKKFLNLICDLFDSVPKNSLLSIIAVTDRPYLIHPKLRRYGRLDREISLKAPTTDQRLEILNALVEELPPLKSLDLSYIAEMTPGYVGTDLQRLANLAVLKSNEENSLVVSDHHLKYAFSKILPSVLQGALGVVDVKSSVSLDQIIGLDSVILELTKTIVWPIRYPSAFRKMGITPAKGLLIFGPPGCAKTTLVRAIASSNQTNFLSVSAAELYTSGVGDSEKLIADLYNRARMAAPCIVFIDELELIVSSRTLEKNANSSNTSLLSMLLTEMDGIGNLAPSSEKSENANVLTGSMVITVAATNRPDLLDSALLRPGRFDRIIPVPPPDKSGRLALLKEITKKIPLSIDVNLIQLAKETEYFSGADLVNFCQEAALCALGEDINVTSVTMAHFEKAKSTLGPSLTPDILQSFYEYADNGSGKFHSIST